MQETHKEGKRKVRPDGSVVCFVPYALI